MGFGAVSLVGLVLAGGKLDPAGPSTALSAGREVPLATPAPVTTAPVTTAPVIAYGAVTTPQGSVPTSTASLTAGSDAAATTHVGSQPVAEFPGVAGRRDSATPWPGSTSRPSPLAGSRPRSTPTGASSSPAAVVLDQINQAREAAGLPALTMRAGLVSSASNHNQAMAGGCGLAHECAGEPGLGDRVSAQGVQWRTVGENIGCAGARTDADIEQVGRSLTSSMLAETPPADGHRRNILSAEFRYIGISLFRDARGMVWMTQDFSG